ncbi:hypothetical protein PRIPAC_71263 [Pristionchus pacificus]|uniref:G protein-coupled receptor n=1 Tax=Pristionchus pacificus TaxID=54126 RepID=A0A2A6C993_PRIPA|nr:hypothetical protein PRIPAC_71263 [Pristionchus pacificus]|eukprot:PDM74581.1 G protein-coupled receptor [Pristionchus pacificus]
MANLTLDVFWLTFVPMYQHVLQFQFMAQVALMVTFTLHYKYTAIMRMTNHREVTIAEKAAAMVVVVSGCVYFVVQTLLMLSRKLTVPLVIQIVPLFIAVGAMITMWGSPGSMNFVLCVMLCHASIHTVFLIMTTPSYRAAVMCSTTHRKMINSKASLVKI